MPMKPVVASVEGVHVVFVEPEIHWNTGNAGRTCLATGAKLHLVGPIGFSLEAKQVRRAGLDYWPRVDPTLWSDFESFEPMLQELGEPYFISPEGARTYWEVEYPARTVLIFGKESTGLGPDLRRKYERRLLRVPMIAESVRGLNLSTCAGVVLYEILRQRTRAAAAAHSRN